MIVVNARFLTQNVTGAQRFAIEISKILNKLKPGRILFVTPYNIINNILAEELNARVIGKNKGTFWEQVDLRIFLLSNKNPLLINFCNTGVVFYKNQIITVHDMSYMVNPLWFSKNFYRWYNFLIPNISKYSFKILTVSNSSKTDILKYLKVKPNKINVVYNSSYINANNNFGSRENGKYILTVSSLEPRKNLNTLIAAFNQIDLDVKLIIVGLKNNNFAQGLNDGLLNSNIVIKGYQSDNELCTLMKYAEAFVYVSYYEGFGLPPLEAMGFGCPVIVSDIAAHREICGNAAIYADPNSVNDIKNKITEVLLSDNLKLELKEAGLKNVKKFNWYKSANIVLNNIDEFF